MQPINACQAFMTAGSNFARSSKPWLIPQAKYRVFLRLGAFSCAAVGRFAFELGIAPGIVVGRLQHDGHLHRTQCNNLKKKVDWVFDQQ